MPAKPQSPTPAGTCAQCGASLEAGARFCRACGARRADSTAGSPELEDVKHPQGQPSVCLKCGYSNSPSTKFCRQCGAELVSPPLARGASSTTTAPGSQRSSRVPSLTLGWSARGELPRWALAAGVIIILLVAGGVAALLFSGEGEGGNPESGAEAGTPSVSVPEANTGTESAAPSTAPSTPSTPSTPASASPAAILAVLHEYESAYSEASLAAMGALFTGDVLRHGLKAGGCSTEAGKRAVLDAYESQFSQNGPVGYELVGLGTGDVQLLGDDEARVETEYSIAAANNSGPISFTLVDRGGSWRISEVDATCSPASR
jgi:ribosomal protein L40E